MRHIRPYFLLESENNEIDLINLCDSLLSHTSAWNEYKGLINTGTKVFIDTQSQRSSEAHFNHLESTSEKVVIEIGGYPKNNKEKGTLAHELVHAIQWLTGREGDSMFINDATRELDFFSDEEIWKKLMFAIYISCPQETESWEAEKIYYREEILDEILPWMRSFNPKEAAEELLSIKPNPNPWELESFEEFPLGWSEAYQNYDEIKSESDIPSLGDLNLEGFLEYYDKAFKKCCEILK